MAILSDVDIARELGENILIFPYKNKNLNGASYNLTASHLAWDLSTKQSLYNQKDKIVIPPKTTALIQTYETVWGSKKIAGSYHSKVGLVSKGLGHISTTLDPDYLGTSLISVYNHNEKDDIQLVVGEDSFVTLVFYCVNTESLIGRGDNHPGGRIDILNQNGINPSNDEWRWLHQGFMNSTEALRIEMEKCDDYQQIVKTRVSLVKKFSSKKLHLFLGLSTVIVILALGILSTYRASLETNAWYTPTTFTLEKSIEAIAVVWITLISNKILNQQK